MPNLYIKNGFRVNQMARYLSVIFILLLCTTLSARQESDETFAIRPVILRFDGKDQYIMLSPMRIYSPYNGLYFALNLTYTPAIMDLKINTGDRLEVDLDHGKFELIAYEVKYDQEEYNAYYHIDKWDLVDIGNSGKASVTIYDQTGQERIVLDRQDLNDYRLFASGYVLGTIFIPEDGPYHKKQWGFFCAGYGNVFNVWLAKYFNFLVPKTDLVAGEFFSAGGGFAPFSYYTYEVVRTPAFDEDTGWYLDYSLSFARREVRSGISCWFDVWSREPQSAQRRFG